MMVFTYENNLQKIKLTPNNRERDAFELWLNC